MKARIITDAHGNITIHMEGGLSYQNSLPLKQQLESITSQNPHSIITLDLHHLDFVGSSGISSFVQTIKAINQKRLQIRISNAKNEFIKVFKLFDLHLRDILIDPFESNDENQYLTHKFIHGK